MVRVGKSAGGGVAVRALEGGGVDVVVEVGWWHQVGGVERLLVVVVGVLGVVEAGLVAQGGGRRGGAGLLVPAGQGCFGCSLRISVLLANYHAVFPSYFSLWSCYETQQTNTKIKMSKTSRVSWAMNSCSPAAWQVEQIGILVRVRGVVACSKNEEF